MTSNRNRGGGSFRDIRNRHLPIFEWRDGHQVSDETPAEPRRPKRTWKRDGIIHYAVDDPD